MSSTPQTTWFKLFKKMADKRTMSSFYNCNGQNNVSAKILGQKVSVNSKGKKVGLQKLIVCNLPEA
jgi:hypothetical protein